MYFQNRSETQISGIMHSNQQRADSARANNQQPGSSNGQFNVGNPMYRHFPSNVNGQPAGNNPIYRHKYFDNYYHYRMMSQIPNNSNPNYPYNPSRFNNESSVFGNAQNFNNIEDAYKYKCMESWKYNDVAKFISNTTAYAFEEDFLTQLIDGKALKLIKIPHLTSVMRMPLGTAVKLMQEINAFKIREI